MPGSIRLGRLGDTYIGVHFTFLPVLAWAAWLGMVQYGGAGGAGFGLLSVTLLFGCVLLHEIAHSLQANACGIRVRYIVLLPIGGLASLDSGAIRPRDEARIALVGPLANLALGLILSGVVLGAGLSTGLDVTSLAVKSLQRPSMLGLLTYLAASNLMLAIFNLLPAFPLDGGRALRAMLGTRMSYEEATHRAAIIGRSFGAGLGAMGFTLMMIGSLPYGVSLVVMALVLYGGATYEDRAVHRHTALQAWTVGQILQTAAQTVAPNEPLSVAMNSITRGRVVPVVVGEQSRLVGLLTINELRHLPGGALNSMIVAHVMRTSFPSVRTSDPLWVAYEKLQRSQLFAIPVVNQHSLCGVVSLADIRRALRNGTPQRQ